MADHDGPSVVIVDDDDAGRRLLRRVLERRGYVVRDASSGRAALELVRSARPVAILLDLRMPGELSGIDVLEALRADAATRDIPAIIVSASVHSDARHRALAFGAAGFIDKPIDFDEVYAALERVLTPRPAP